MKFNIGKIILLSKNSIIRKYFYSSINSDNYLTICNRNKKMMRLKINGFQIFNLL